MLHIKQKFFIYETRKDKFNITNHINTQNTHILRKSYVEHRACIASLNVIFVIFSIILTK